MYQKFLNLKKGVEWSRSLESRLNKQIHMYIEEKTFISKRKFCKYTLLLGNLTILNFNNSSKAYYAQFLSLIYGFFFNFCRSQKTPLQTFQQVNFPWKIFHRKIISNSLANTLKKYFWRKHQTNFRFSFVDELKLAEILIKFLNSYLFLFYRRLISCVRLYRVGKPN